MVCAPGLPREPAGIDAVSSPVSDFSMRLTRRLLLWSSLSIAVGLLLLMAEYPVWRAVGVQAVAWGSIDGLIAFLGRWNLRRRQPGGRSAENRDASSLRRLLLINAALDILYLSAGIVIARTLGRDDPAWRGHGVGIGVQAVFLFFFDLLHAQRVPYPGFAVPSGLFSGPDHEDFLLEGGKPAALLVHGFPGTPAEMRPLAHVLHESGWTVRGILLPGFGPQLASLVQRRPADWTAAMENALLELGQDHSPLVLVGYSMGGALSIAVGARVRIDGLVLAAPFWWPESPLTVLLGWVLRPFLPQAFQPLQRADFSDFRLRRFLAGILPTLDLNDPAVQGELRQLLLPIELFDTLRQVSRQGFQRISAIRVPTLVLQGRIDEAIRPGNTQKLLSKFPLPPFYVELEGGHELVDPDQPTWPGVVQAVCAFAESMLSPTSAGRAT